MDEVASLYERDFLQWTEEQAQALRAAVRSGVNLPLDWENLAEEIESLGRRDRRELGSRIQRIIEHLLKLENSPARDPREGWIETIEAQRARIESVLRGSPSLRQQVLGAIQEEAPYAAGVASRSLLRQGEITAPLAVPAYTEDQVLGDWFPADGTLA